MQTEFQVEMRDGRTLNAECGVREFVHLERAFDVSITDMGDDPESMELSLEHLMYLAHSALTRVDEVPEDFDDFLDQVAGFDADPEDEDPST